MNIKHVKEEVIMWGKNVFTKTASHAMTSMENISKKTKFVCEF